MRILILLLFVLTFQSCITSRISQLNSLVRHKEGNTYYLKSGNFNLFKSFNIPSNAVLIGNKTNLYFNNESSFPLFIINESDAIQLKSISFIGEDLENTEEKITYQKYNSQFLITVYNSNNIKIDSCNFKNSYGTVIHISDSKNISINKTTFENIGVTTSLDGFYSYDAVFIGGYKKSENINLTSNTFKNIGSAFPTTNYPWPNDGDGIHIQGVGETNNITITENKFINCASRGVKVQSGLRVKIENNDFLSCRAAVNLAMAKDVKSITINNNSVRKSKYPFGSDSFSPGFTAYDIEVSNNKIDSCDHFFRTSGYSNIQGGFISNNTIGQTGTYFIDGRFKNFIIEKNTINKYSTHNDPSDNMAMYIEPDSDNLIVRNNRFGKTKGSRQEILNFGKGKVTIENNRIFGINETIPNN